MSRDINLECKMNLAILFDDLSVTKHALIFNLDMNDLLKFLDKQLTPISPILTLDKLRIFKHLQLISN